MSKKRLYIVKILLFAMYGVLLYAVGFTLSTWKFWVMLLLSVTISFVSYIEGGRENDI